MRKVMSSSGPSPRVACSASSVPYQRMATIIMPPNTSLTGLVRLEKRWARSTRFLKRLASSWNRPVSYASAV